MGLTAGESCYSTVIIPTFCKNLLHTIEMYLQGLRYPIAHIDWVLLLTIPKSTLDTLNLLAFHKTFYALLMLKTYFTIFIKIYGTICSYSYIT